MASDDDRGTIARLYRRAGFGLAPGELDARAASGVTATIERLVDPDGAEEALAPDPWAEVTLTAPVALAGASQADKQKVRQQQRTEANAAIGAWLDHMAASPRP
ncbi:MAG: DUF1800 family protein, partial [Acidimicrobiales bacterium]